MKAFFSLCLCAMMAGNATAQTTSNDEKANPAESSYVICNNPDTPAHFEGGERAVNNFIKEYFCPSVAGTFTVIGVLLIDRDNDGIPDQWEEQKEDKK